MRIYYVRLRGDGDGWKHTTARNAQAALKTLSGPGEVITNAEYKRRFGWYLDNPVAKYSGLYNSPSRGAEERWPKLKK